MTFCIPTLYPNPIKLFTCQATVTCWKQPLGQPWYTSVGIVSGQIIVLHQPRYAWNKGISLPQLPFEVWFLKPNDAICMAKLHQIWSWDREKKSKSRRFSRRSGKICSKYKHYGCCQSKNGTYVKIYTNHQWINNILNYRIIATWTHDKQQQQQQQEQEQQQQQQQQHIANWNLQFSDCIPICLSHCHVVTHPKGCGSSIRRSAWWASLRGLESHQESQSWNVPIFRF